MDTSALDAIKGFVAGIVSPHEFRDRLYSDGSFETLLTNDPTLPASNYVVSSGSTYHFVIAQDYDDPSGILNAQGALCEFMERNRIEYQRTEQYSEMYDLILEAQPDWLAVDPRYVAICMLPDASGRTGTELEEWLANEFRARFRYVSTPPRWIQSPSWPIGETGPLLFLGQFELNNYFHDDAAVYVFHDPNDGSCETVIQVY